MATMNELINEIYRIAKEEHGIDNPLDKCKYREIQIAEILDHTVFTGASGGKDNDDTYGADAVSKDGRKAEYKTKTLKESEFEKMAEKGYVDFVGVYNGAYQFESIERYKNIDHYFSIHRHGDVVAIIQVDTNYLIKVLHENNNRREEKTKQALKEGRSAPTTNCNQVKVRIGRNVECDVAKIVYRNKNYSF